MHSEVEPYFVRYEKLPKGTKPWLPYRIISNYTGDIIVAVKTKTGARLICSMMNEHAMSVNQAV